MGVKVVVPLNADPFIGNYDDVGNTIHVPAKIVSILVGHETRHAHLTRRKIVDGYDSLLLGELAAAESNPQYELPIWDGAGLFPLPALNAVKQVGLFGESGALPSLPWLYLRRQSLQELATYPLQCRQLVSKIVVASREGRVGEVASLTTHLLKAARYLWLISQQSRARIGRAKTELDNSSFRDVVDRKSVTFRYETHHGMEMIRGVGHPVEYDVLHARQFSPGARNSDGQLLDADLMIDIPLANSTPMRAFPDYHRRLVDLMDLCEQSSAHLRELMLIADDALVEADKYRHGNNLSTSRLQDNVDKLLATANKLASLIRAKNNIPLDHPVARRAAAKPRDEGRLLIQR